MPKEMDQTLTVASLKRPLMTQDDQEASYRWRNIDDSPFQTNEA